MMANRCKNPVKIHDFADGHDGYCGLCVQAGVPELVAEVKRLKAMLTSVQDCLCNVAQILDGWHADGTVWSEWDEKVRRQVSKVAIEVDGEVPHE